MREALGQVCLQVYGPVVVASAVGGAAAPPAGLGGLSALGMDMAWRGLLNRPDNLAAAAGAVGAAAPPGSWGGVSILSVMAVQGDRGELVGSHWRLPSLFEVQDPGRRGVQKAVRGASSADGGNV